MSAKRINALRKLLAAQNLDGMIVTHLDYIRYLTGFTGSAGVLAIIGREAHFITDFRYDDQANKQVTGAKVKIARNADTLERLKDIKKLAEKNVRIGIDGEHVTLSGQENLKSILPDALLIPAQSVLTELGWVKDRSEIASIKKACAISDKAFEYILGMIEPGISERELAAELEYQMAVAGSEKPAFESIVASGYRSAMPHGVASDKQVEPGDFITFDFGATVDGYVSDMTRTVVLGKATAKQKKIYDIVLRSQKAGVRAVKAGVSGKKVDETCRNIIRKAGYEKEFGHGTGHGIGFYVHVGPRVSSKSEDVLKVNNVVTIEPGIYISGWGGVRIEDDVVVTKTGCQVLNKAPKKLLEL